MADSKNTVRVRQVRSGASCPKDQNETLRSLGLGKIGRERELTDNESVRGMIFKVKHLVEVVED